MGATKARDLLVNVLSVGSKLELVDTLKNCIFSIGLDESNDISQEKLLVIEFRYVNYIANEISVLMWELVTVFMKDVEADCGAERMRDCVIDSFNQYKVPVKNILSVCTDGASTMIGDVSGLKARLQNDIQNLIWMQCPDHKCHLCMDHGLDFILTEIIKLIKQFYTMLKSSKRRRNFANLQRRMGLPLHRIPLFIKLRWLSVLHCVDIDLEQWPALLEFSSNLKDSRGKLDELAQKVHNKMIEPDTILYFHLVQHAAVPLTELNLFLQKKELVNPQAAERIETTFKTILSSIMNREYILLTPAADINLFDSSKYLMFADFELGHKI